MSLLIDTTSLIPGALVIGNTGLGVIGSSIPSSGKDGPSFLYNDLVFPADNNVEVMGRIKTFPSQGTLFAYEDGSFYWEAPSAGLHDTFVYTLYIDGVSAGDATVTLNSNISNGTSSISLGDLGNTFVSTARAQSINNFTLSGFTNLETGVSPITASNVFTLSNFAFTQSATTTITATNSYTLGSIGFVQTSGLDSYAASSITLGNIGFTQVGSTNRTATNDFTLGNLGFIQTSGLGSTAVNNYTLGNFVQTLTATSTSSAISNGSSSNTLGNLIQITQGRSTATADSSITINPFGFSSSSRLIAYASSATTLDSFGFGSTVGVRPMSIASSSISLDSVMSSMTINSVSRSLNNFRLGYISSYTEASGVLFAKSTLKLQTIKSIADSTVFNANPIPYAQKMQIQGIVLDLTKEVPFIDMQSYFTYGAYLKFSLIMMQDIGIRCTYHGTLVGKPTRVGFFDAQLQVTDGFSTINTNVFKITVSDNKPQVGFASVQSGVGGNIAHGLGFDTSSTEAGAKKKPNN